MLECKCGSAQNWLPFFQTTFPIVMAILGAAWLNNKRLDSIEISWNKRLDGVELSLNKRIDNIDKRLDGIDRRLESIDGSIRNLDRRVTPA